ncbi:hypothetical protein BO71DRAFT_431632 [Aspergillus ellipticus CBS 707.79]|uniref:Zn(2)-C6 fungal-type domain-containing protein n=1 Tax=Aspergillus ellipticus CBS 707.79 TaxID=1448320 RepID=A0A319DNC9_9EURO|nr:hypothetical protein BO71DRAFT_431632 [Aspergillus ellipticus CBS 707.79]
MADLSPKPRRRQFTSCDPCRRSKRRCSLQPSREEGLKSVCTNCKRLGHRCTFDFVHSRPASRPRKRQQRGAISPRLSDGVTALDQVADTFADLPNNEFEASLVADQDVLATWLNFSPNGYQDYDAYCLPGSPSLSDTIADIGSELVAKRDAPRDTPTSTNHSWTMQHTKPAKMQLFVGSSIKSPIRLLNSKLEATMLDECLIAIYNTILTGCASRFVDYDCNLYATGSRYQLESKVSGRSQETGLEVANCSHKSPMLATDSPPEMTVLGAVYFLDHFSDLYGNRLSPTSRKLSDAVLKAVLRAFSLQWLPTFHDASEQILTTYNDTFEGNLPEWDPGHKPMVDVFHDAWARARSLVEEARSVPSFHVVCAILMFEGIVVPVKATKPPVAHEFLRVGLQKLRHLDRLVRKYCIKLGPNSNYSALLTTSLDIVCWSGYIRDTGAALFMDYQCEFSGLPRCAKVPLGHTTSIDWSRDKVLLQDLEEDAPGLFRHAVVESFHVWRQMIKVKSLLSGLGDDIFCHSPVISEGITATVASVERFDQTFRFLVDSCIEKFSLLSMELRVFIVSVVTFWDLGILVFAEIMKPAIDGIDSACDSHVTDKIRAFQQTAVSSIARTIGYTLSLPAKDVFNLQNGLSAEVPMTAYHITPSLMVTAFRMAIETIIELYLFPSYVEDADPQVPGPAIDDFWQKQIDIIMKGLLSLEATLGGSQAVDMALQILLHRHGDILSECWTCDFSP